MTAIAFVASLSLSMMSCSSDPELDPDDSGTINKEDPKEIEKTLNSIATEWGMSFELVKTHMDGYTLVRSDKNFLMYTDKGNKHYYSYKFVEDSLCSSLLLMPQVEDMDLSDFLRGFSYIGELDNTQVYHNTSKNVLASTYETDKNNTKYQTVGFTPIFPTAEEKGDISSEVENDHEFVDLGLSVKWATCNIGASKPEEYGGYYAWGETEEKDYYSWSNYTHCDGTLGSCHYIGKDIAGTEYDVAHVNWGGSWRMPTSDQIRELFDKCSRTWTQKNGVNGFLFTSSNGNTIFLPAAGSLWYDDFNPEGINGDYWSSQSGEYEFYANDLIFYSYRWFFGNYNFGYRSKGLSVRAVCP